jgi:phenylalanyl-tRNA synthetase alpha chain
VGRFNCLKKQTYKEIVVDQSIDKIFAAATREIETAGTPDIVQGLNTKYLGRKGLVTQFLRNIAQLSAEERPTAGRRANEVKQQIESLCREAVERISSSGADDGPRIDVTLPGRAMPQGCLHPVTRISDTICAIFSRMGFEVVEGPEVENDYYNFEALNFPRNHPARDMQDTFFISEDVVLRTHTSPTQPRVMEKQDPPVRIIAPGKVYRCDSDLTHTPMFHQVEGLLVDEGISFGDLKGVLTGFVHQMFDEETSLRFRPSFFPFTEPSAEVDIRCVICRGSGCRVCSHTGWIEILGSGMVHPAVLENVGYDTSRFTGFAFGMGVERVAMLKFSIDDIRKYFDNDIRFLNQF